jgi:FkbM family methyltransferase
MKAFVKACAAQLVAMLPRGIQKAIFDRAIAGHAVGYDTLCKLAETFNVVALSVKGEYGIIQNSISDRVITRYYAETGRWATQPNEMLIALFAGKGGTYVDVGANVGLTTIPIAQNPRVSCLALEPEPGNFSFLSANIAANCPHGNVVTKRVAVFERPDTLRFEIAPDNLGDHRIRLRDVAGQENEQQRTTIEVEALPLDDLVEVTDRPLAVKIDTQGAEPYVVKGGRKTLSAADLLILEFWPYGMARMGGDPEEVIRFLEQDFSTISLLEGEGATPSPAEPSKQAAGRLRQMMSERASDHVFYVNVIARKDRLSPH